MLITEGDGRRVMGESSGRIGRPPLSDDGVTRVTASLTPEHMECIKAIRQKYDLGGAPAAAVIRKALEIAAEQER